MWNGEHGDHVKLLKNLHIKVKHRNSERTLVDHMLHPIQEHGQAVIYYETSREAFFLENLDSSWKI